MTFARNLEIESYTLYAIGVLLITARMISRRLLLGSWKKLQPDDYLMCVVLVTFTGVAVSVNQVAQNLSNYLPPGVAETLTPSERQNAIFGSKFVFVLEECQLFTTWLVKACLLLLYHQLTSGLKQTLAVKIVAGYCLLGFLVVQILFLGVWCRPIQQYWAVPVKNSQCASYYHHMETATTFNISSDLMMLCIPIPILLKAQLPPRRKAVLVAVFSLGIFVIITAVLNRYYNFTQPFGSLVYLNWYVGEAATSVYVANIPLCWPLLRRMFNLSSFNASSKRTRDGSNLESQTRFQSIAARSANRPKREWYERSESEERIAGAGAGAGSWGSHGASNDGTLELEPVEIRDRYKANVTALPEGDDSSWDTRRSDDKSQANIVKTVQIHQQYD